MREYQIGREKVGVDDVRKRIRALREAKGLRAIDVAQKIGMSRPFYTQLESGARGLSVCHLFKIAKALNVTVGELCGETLEDKQVARMNGHLIPINDQQIWDVLKPFLAEEPEDFAEWEIILSEVLKKLRQAKGERQASERGEKQEHMIAG